ncbi:hypothetical protein [Nocardioides sp. MH1]|uniref:hypothetical protein n=1 Tax=Nocardioides sp. MH1 TaxID=3242490 RepID=UPI00351FE189
MTVLEIATYGRNTLRRRRLEARILEPAVQPGLAPAYELDPRAPTATLLTELLPDVTLDDLVGVSPLPAAAALHALRDVAATLHAMHECGLVHGDLRPSGVLVLPDGRAALARCDSSPAARGTDRTTAARADSHGFAVLAFELLTAIHPLDPTDVAAMVATLGELPPAAAGVLAHALTAAPAQRPLPLELVGALEDIPADQWPSNQLRPVERALPPVEAAPPPPVEAAPPPPVESAPPPVESAPPPPEGAPGLSATTERVHPQRPLWRRIVSAITIVLGLLTVVGGGGAGAWMLFTPAPTAGDAAPPVQVQRVALSITPPQVTCPRAALHLAATILTDGGEGPLQVRWRLPDGTLAQTQSLMAESGERVVRTSFDLDLTGRRRIVGNVRAVVSPAGVVATAPLRYLCEGAFKPARHSPRI